MDAPARPRLDALTGLRYLAALSVLLSHMSDNLPGGPGGPWGRFLKPLSALGMPLFFTLSGFLMAYNYSAGFRERFARTTWTFYVARVARIYPVYLVCLLLHFSFVGNFFHDLRDHPADTWRSLRYVGTLTQSWVHTPVFADDHKPRTVCQSYMGVAWSVSTEAFFYAVFPLVAIPLARAVTGRRRMLIAAAAVYGLYLLAGYRVYAAVPPEAFADPAFGHSRHWWKIYLCPYMRFGEFLVGAVVGQYFLVRADQPAPSGWRWFAGAGLLAAAAVALVGLNYRVVQPREVYGYEPARQWVQMAAYNILYAPLCAVILYQFATLPSLARRAMGCRLMVLLGEMSYCMYLLHPLAQSFYHERSVGEGPLKAPYVIVYNNLAMVVVLHFLCLGMYRYLELPARTAIRRVLDPKPGPKLRLATTPGDGGTRRAA